VAGATYPPITLTVTVAEDAPTVLLNEVTVSGGSDASSTNNRAFDQVELFITRHDLYLPVIQRK
jgi:hypothetical protein